MRQRQPNRAQLREAGSARIEDPASNVQVGDSVAIVEHRTVVQAPDDSGGRGRQAEQENGLVFQVRPHFVVEVAASDDLRSLGEILIGTEMDWAIEKAMRPLRARTIARIIQ